MTREGGKVNVNWRFFHLILNLFHWNSTEFSQSVGGREGNDLHWTWGGAHIILTLSCWLLQKFKKLYIIIYRIKFRRTYRFVSALIWPLILFVNGWKWNFFLLDKNTDTTDWFPRHVATFGCRPLWLFWHDVAGRFS